VLALLWLVAPATAAHPAVSAVAVVKIEPGGRATITLTHDCLAFALNEQPANIGDEPMLTLLDGPAEDLAAALKDARERFASQMHVRADGKEAGFQITESPTADAARRWRRENPKGRLPLRLDLVATAQLAPDAREVSFQFPAALGEVIVLLDRPDLEPTNIPLGPGEQSVGFTPNLSPSPAPDSPADAGFWSVAWHYVRFGFTHIIPQGRDHTLFVLGLFLLSPHPRRILWPITAFTVAHTTTVFLTAFQVVRSPPPAIVEPAIAATIAFVAIENLVVKRVHPWRPALAFAFGLIHGMGFAGDLSKVAMPTGQLVTAVLAFNIGVEGGHLTVLGAAFVLLGWARDKPWYRPRVAVPISVAIAAVAAIWVVQRLA
jgi:hypothetical protein